MSKILLAALLCWTVAATPVRTIDGDTFVATVEVWMGTAGPVTVSERIRVLGVNTPERKDETYEAWASARAFTAAWLAKGPVTIHACRRDGFLRVLGTVTRGGENLASELIKAGLGTAR